MVVILYQIKTKLTKGGMYMDGADFCIGVILGYFLTNATFYIALKLYR